MTLSSHLSKKRKILIYNVKFDLELISFISEAKNLIILNILFQFTYEIYLVVLILFV